MHIHNTQCTIHRHTIHRHTTGKGAITSPSSMFNSYTRPHKHVIRIVRKLLMTSMYEIYRCTNFYNVSMHIIFQRRTFSRKWPHITCILILICLHKLWFTRVTQCQPVCQNNWVQFTMRHVSTYALSLIYITTRLI